MLIAEGRVQPLLMVGVHHAGVGRVEEYTPTKVAKLGGGRANAYGRLLAEELKPTIDHRYRTLQDREHTGLGGSSLGGLSTLHLGLRHADVFGYLAVMSPSVWWGNRVILRTVAKARPRPNTRIWLDTGTAEGADALADARRLREALVGAGWREDDDLRYSEHDGATHSEAAWGARVGEVLEYLFPGDFT
jgi:predicted alpha/beta superfamily hydrolase